MGNEDLLLYVRRASRGQVQTAAAVAVLILAAFLITLPFSEVALPRYPAVVPVIDSVLFLGDGITAAILFSQAAILRSRALITLATGYFFSALIIVPHALSFPGVFAPQGLIGGGADVTARLYYLWHLALPASVIAYAVLQRASESSPVPRKPVPGAIAWSIAGSLTMAVALTLLLGAGYDPFPGIMTNSIQWSRTNLGWTAASLVFLIVVAFIFVARGRRSLIDIWLMVTMWAWMLELFQLMASSARYNVGWYSGRLAGMLSGVFVLAALLIEMSRLYTQFALSAATEQHQREGRLMSLDAAAAAIAHEVKQPITAMVTNASAALVRMRQDQPDLAKVTRSLELIVEDGHRGADVIGSVRELFGSRETAETPVDLNQLVRETINLRSVEIASRAIAISRDLAPDLPAIPVRPQQMRQVFVNILNNAIEALGERPAGPRRILIRSAPTDDGGVAIDIGDTGRGIAADRTNRIFEAFFTTKTYGTGLGLPLCRSIVERHGGSLTVTSIEGEGTTFHILLPGQAS